MRKNLMSKLSHLKRLSVITALSTAVALGMMTAAQASVLHNGWNYAIDSFNDSTYRTYPGGPTAVGGGIFEGYGLAYRDDIDNNTLTFAINANLPQNGAVVPYATGYNHTGWGDFFIQTTQGLLGINFTTALGIYQVTSTKSVATAHDGWPTNTSYTNAVINSGKNPTMGDLAQNQAPFGDSTHNVIASGNFLDNIQPANLSGLNFSHFGAIGSQTFGFSINRTLVSPGDFVAWILQECANEWMAILGNVAEKPPIIHDPEDPKVSVPEPSSLTGIFTLGTISVLAFSKRKQQKKAVVTG